MIEVFEQGIFLFGRARKLRAVRSSLLMTVIVAFSTTSIFAQSTADNSALAQAYSNCATAAAIRLAAGPDAADLIARAATESCIPEMQKLADEIAKTNSSPAYASSFFEQLNTVLVRRLKLMILEARAAKQIK